MMKEMKVKSGPSGTCRYIEVIEKSKPFLNTDEAGNLIGRSPGAIRNLVMRRAIPFRKAGGRLIFIREELEAWIKGSPGITWKEIQDQSRDPFYS